MHLETLKTFCDLVESRSFSKAARLNYVSQSAVSQQLKALEGRYGQLLLERGGHRGVMPTDAGRIFYAACKELLGRFAAAEERVRAPTTVLTGTVRIATVYSVGLHTLPPFVTRFMKVQPQVKVHIEYSRTDKVCDACAGGAIDLGIVALPLPRSRVTVVPWSEEALVLVCAPGHRLGRRKTVSFRQLNGLEFVAFERDIPTRKTIDRILKAHGVAVSTVMEFDNIETIKRSVEVGSGVSILPESTVTNEVRNGLLASVRFAEGRFTRTIAIVHGRGRVLNVPALRFLQLLVERR